MVLTSDEQQRIDAENNRYWGAALPLRPSVVSQRYTAAEMNRARAEMSAFGLEGNTTPEHIIAYLEDRIIVSRGFTQGSITGNDARPTRAEWVEKLANLYVEQGIGETYDAAVDAITHFLGTCRAIHKKPLEQSVKPLDLNDDPEIRAWHRDGR